jgi:hypothetical protein
VHQLGGGEPAEVDRFPAPSLATESTLAGQADAVYFGCSPASARAPAWRA